MYRCQFQALAEVYMVVPTVVTRANRSTRISSCVSSSRHARWYSEAIADAYAVWLFNLLEDFKQRPVHHWRFLGSRFRDYQDSKFLSLHSGLRVCEPWLLHLLLPTILLHPWKMHFVLSPPVVVVLAAVNHVLLLLVCGPGSSWCFMMGLERVAWAWDRITSGRAADPSSLPSSG